MMTSLEILRFFPYVIWKHLLIWEYIVHIVDGEYPHPLSLTLWKKFFNSMESGIEHSYSGKWDTNRSHPFKYCDFDLNGSNYESGL